MEGKKTATQQPAKSSGESETKQTSNSSATPKQRFTVKKWTAVALWAWDIETDNCAICRNHIQEKCIECQANQTDEDCKPVWGTCNHGFHLHCITRWLKTRNVCPMDNKEWETKKVGN